MSQIAELRRLITSAQSATAFTGAGISTESGIPDFRSPGGVWTRHKPVMYDEFVTSRAARVRFWKARIEMYEQFRNAKPNDGHLALAKLETQGRLQAVITQNIDGLHQLAGSKNVIELHGTARIVACIGCGKEWTPDDVHAMVAAGDEAPDCDHCGSPLKSKTVSFGQPMPEREMAKAARLACECDLMLAIGSSLVVEPAASIPRLAKDVAARTRILSRTAISVATLVIINHEETPVDHMADLVIRAPIGQTLSGVVAGLGWNDATRFKQESDGEC